MDSVASISFSTIVLIRKGTMGQKACKNLQGVSEVIYAGVIMYNLFFQLFIAYWSKPE